MPIRKSGSKSGKPCYQYGSQKVYCGGGAKKRAQKQAIAIKISQGKIKVR